MNAILSRVESREGRAPPQALRSRQEALLHRAHSSLPDVAPHRGPPDPHRRGRAEARRQDAPSGGRRRRHRPGGASPDRPAGKESIGERVDSRGRHVRGRRPAAPRRNRSRRAAHDSPDASCRSRALRRHRCQLAHEPAGQPPRRDVVRATVRRAAEPLRRILSGSGDRARSRLPDAGDRRAAPRRVVAPRLRARRPQPPELDSPSLRADRGGGLGARRGRRLPTSRPQLLPRVRDVRAAAHTDAGGLRRRVR